jgi:hypothetical protein
MSCPLVFASRPGDILSDNRTVPRPGDKIKIPLSEKEAVSLLLRVKPTADMPRPGASKPKAKKKPTSKKQAE